MTARLLAPALAFAAAAFLSPGQARADADDVKWINQCIADNQDQGQTPQVIKSYCTCMNDKMPSSETRTITQWEKTHKKEADACSAQAGWKDK